MTTTDANGAFHDQSGRFDGHVQTETDTEQVLPSMNLPGVNPKTTAAEKELLTAMRGRFHVEDYSDEPGARFAKEALKEFPDRRIAAVFNEFRGHGETDMCDPYFIVFDDNGAAHPSPELDAWFCGNPDGDEDTTADAEPPAFCSTRSRPSTWPTSST